MEPVNIPSYIDDPPHFLLWSADEMAPILLGLVIGIFTGNALVLCLLGLVTTKLYRRFTYEFDIDIEQYRPKLSWMDTYEGQARTKRVREKLTHEQNRRVNDANQN